jgi:hypothetical protein
MSHLYKCTYSHTVMTYKAVLQPLHNQDLLKLQTPFHILSNINIFTNLPKY